MIGRLAALAVAVATLPCAAAGSADGLISAPIPLDTAVAGASRFGNSHASNEPSLSPDGELLALTLSEPVRFAIGANVLRTARGVPKIFEGAAIWIAETSGAATERVTPPGVNSWAATWSPDGNALAFLADHSGDVGLWIWSRSERRAQQVREVRPAPNVYGFDYLVWADTGHVLLKVQRGKGLQPGALASASSEAATTRGRVDVYDWPPQSPQDGKLSTRPLVESAFDADVAIVDIQSGAAKKLTTADELPGHFTLSPDGTKLALSVLRAGDEKEGYNDYEIVVLDLKNGSKVSVQPRVRELFGPPPMSWSPHGEYLAYSSWTSGYRHTGEGECFVWSAREQRVRNVSAEIPHRYFGNYSTPPAWGQRQRVYALSARRGEESVIWQMSADGSEKAERLDVSGIGIHRLIPVTTPDGFKPGGGAPDFLAVGSDGSPDSTVTLGYFESGGWKRLWSGNYESNAAGHHRGFAFAKAGGGVAFMREAANEPPEFWYAPAFSAAPRKITHVSRELQRYALGTPKLLSFVNDWGARLYVSLLLPPGYQPGKRYPTVVTAYPNDTGGRQITRFGLGIQWGLDGQLLATRGYVVAFVDCPIRVGRGSTMQDIAGNVIPAVQTMIDLGISDPKRIGVMGQSRGGYLVMALVAQTNLFSAAISVDPSVVHLPASAGEMQYGGVLGGYGQTMWIDGNLWENTRGWIENSPFFYFPQVTTPVWVAAGGDSRAIVGEQIYAGLAQLGKRVSYARYFAEGHVPSLWTAANYRDFLERSIAWLDRYLKPEVATSGVP